MPLFKKPIEQEFFNLRLRAGRPMTELEFYAKELTDWETSPERREMIDGDRYYTGDHDILKRQRTAIGPDGKLIVIENLPNNRIVDNQYAKHVDQKANYLLGQPISFSCENDDYAAEVKKVQCIASYPTIAKKLGISVNTVAKYVAALEEHGLIRTERTEIITKDGRKRNGCLRYTILPIKNALGLCYERQMEKAAQALERQRAQARAEKLGVQFVPADDEQSA